MQQMIIHNRTAKNYQQLFGKLTDTKNEKVKIGIRHLSDTVCVVVYCIRALLNHLSLVNHNLKSVTV